MAAIVAGLNTVQILKNISDGLDGCDILIYLDHLQREEFEEIDDWLKKNYESMEKLADQINQHTTIDMKVIFCSTGPICFCANVLQALTKLAKSSIVAVSAHYGLEIMYAYIVSFGFDPKYFGCPPVWGFLGISTFVDIGHMLQKYNHSELRWFFYMTHDKNPYKYLIQYKDITSYQVGRTEDLQKSKAICDLLKLWYKDKKHMENEIISLGIPSNGAFGIPKGLIYSQPVTLQVSEDNTRIWVPFENFPLPNTPSSTFYNLIFTAECITKKFIQKTPLLYHPNGNMSSCSMLAEEENRNEWEENSFIEFT
ncbi:putative malate dehydrogenase 1B isoform X2 [Prorops nasuta]